MRRWVPVIREHLPQTVGFLILLVLAAGMLLNMEIKWKAEEESAVGEAKFAAGGVNPLLSHEELPDPARFEPVAETDALILRFDQGTGHFIVTDKRSGKDWHSFPNPEHWADETIGGIWKHHLRAPVMIQTLEFEKRNARPEMTNWISANGTIQDFQRIPNGVKLTYILTDAEVAIPVEITVRDDYVETKIVDDAIVEGKKGLLWVRLFPFFGSLHTTAEEGYFLIPDGSGAIMSFVDASRNSVNMYREPIYGHDPAYRSDESSRHPVLMPVFGLMSGDGGFLSVVTEGEEYTNILASPAGVYSLYNWITAEMRYRSPYEQVTNRHRNRSFLTYDADHRFGSDRAVRYFLLTEEQSTYAGMASRYRQYLIEEQGFQRLTPEPNIPLHLSLIGGDRESGTFLDRYVPMTTSSQAMNIVETLYGMGVENMAVNLIGWQKGGYTSFGSVLPVDPRLGGNEGMKSFIDFAHSLDFPVTYGVNYLLNNTGAHGFFSRYSAMRDMSGTILHYGDWYGNSLPLVSHRFLASYFAEDLARLKALNFDGLTFGHGYGYGGGLGQFLVSDYNNRIGSSRSEAMELQADYYRQAAETFPMISSTATGQYVNAYVNHIYDLADDYSYDLFSDRSVPFLQIALHGLVTYSSVYINERSEYEEQRLRDLEYGALPSFAFTHEPTFEMNDSYSLRMFSTQYEDWAEKAVREYQIYNRVLAGVQDQFIVNHRMLAEDVFETTYENGTRVIVNYRPSPYRDGSLQVDARGYLVVEGAEGT